MIDAESSRRGKQFPVEFFEADERARAIRQSALEVLRILARYLRLGVREAHRREELLAQIELHAQTLVALGIVERMDTDDGRLDYEADAVLTAEWLAGNALQVLSNVRSLGILPVVQCETSYDMDGSMLLEGVVLSLRRMFDDGV